MSLSNKITEKTGLYLAITLDDIRVELTAPNRATSNKAGSVAAPPTSLYHEPPQYCPYRNPRGSKNLVEVDVEGQKKAAAGVTIANTPRGFYTVYTTQHLPEGLSIVNSVGNGRIEIINLEEISLPTIRSAGAGMGLDTDRKLANAFHLRGIKVVEAIEKCAIAARYSGESHASSNLDKPESSTYVNTLADKGVLQFNNLPNEIRKSIFEVCRIVLSHKTLIITIEILVICGAFTPIFRVSSDSLNPNLPKPSINY